MLVALRKIKTYLVYFMRAKKVWSKPRQSKVLIFDGHRSELLMPYLNQWNPEVLNTRGEKINIWAFFYSLFHGGNKREAYTDCFIRLVDPQMIITIIDNNINFIKLKSRHPNRHTVFVQNGFRGYYDDIFETLDSISMEDQKLLAVDTMFTFGKVISTEFKKTITGETIEIGSIKNNQISIAHQKKKNRIIFISQWHEEGFIFSGKVISHKEFFENADRSILEFTNKYAAEHGLELKIVLRNFQNDICRQNEEEYFQKILNGKAQFLTPMGEFPSYVAVDEAELVVTIDTTLGYESAVRGNKTAIISVRSDFLQLKGFTFGWPGDYGKEGTFFCNEANVVTYGKIFDRLMSINHEEWKKLLLESSFTELIQYDSGNKTFISFLEKTLSSHK